MLFVFCAMLLSLLLLFMLLLLCIAVCVIGNNVAHAYGVDAVIVIIVISVVDECGVSDVGIAVILVVLLFM